MSTGPQPRASKAPRHWKESAVARIAALLAVAVALVVVSGPFLFSSGLTRELVFPLLTGVSGAIGARWFRVRWPEPLLASILLAAGMLVTFGDTLSLRLLLTACATVSIGVFLLPLLDPVIRKQDLGFPRWRAAAAAAVVTAGVVAVVYVVSGGGQEMAEIALLWLHWAATVLCAAGIVVSLALDRYTGALIGASGALAWYGAYVLYFLLALVFPAPFAVPAVSLVLVAPLLAGKSCGRTLAGDGVL